MPDKKDAIIVLDDVIPNCQEIVSILERQQWIPSRVGTGRDHGYIDQRRTSSTCGFPILSFSNPPEIHQMNYAVWSAFDEYARMWDFSFSGFDDVSIQKYEIGEKFDLHFDGGAGMANRVVSGVAYLNTVAEGGETHFPYADVTVSPVEGRLVIFPSNYVYAHAAFPPVSGVKYSAAYWALG